MAEPSRNGDKPPWHFRRRIIISTLLFCGLSMSYALKQGPELVSVAFPSLASLAGAVLVAAIGGAVWDDKGKGSP